MYRWGLSCCPSQRSCGFVETPCGCVGSVDTWPDPAALNIQFPYRFRRPSRTYVFQPSGVGVVAPNRVALQLLSLHRGTMRWLAHMRWTPSVHQSLWWTSQGCRCSEWNSLKSILETGFVDTVQMYGEVTRNIKKVLKVRKDTK